MKLFKQICPIDGAHLNFKLNCIQHDNLNTFRDAKHNFLNTIYSIYNNFNWRTRNNEISKVSVAK